MNCTKNAIRVVVMLLSIAMLIVSFPMAVSAAGGVKVEIGSADVDYATGTRVKIPVNITENSGFVSLQLDVSYDAASLKLIGWEEGEIFPYTGSATAAADKRNANNYTAYSAQDFASNPFRIMYTDGDAVKDTTATGKLITLVFEAIGKTNNTFDVEATVVSVLSQGTTNVDPTENEVAIPDDVTTSSTATAGGVSVTGYKKGSVNGDGAVNNDDVVLLIRHMMIGLPLNYGGQAADFTADGTVNNDDVVRLIRHMMIGIPLL